MNIDPYTLIHKAQRKHLYELITLAGRIDWNAAATVCVLRDDTQALIRHLRAHAQHEEQFIHPLLRQVPGTCEPLETEHRELEAALDALDEAIRNLADGDAQQGLRFYRSLATFASIYTAHLAHEEANLPALWKHCSDTELAAMMTAFKNSRPLDEAIADLIFMLPALNPGELKKVLVGLKSAPMEILNAARDCVRRSMPKANYDLLCQQAGVPPA